MAKSAISMAIFHESEPRGELDGIATMILEAVGGEGILVGPGDHQPR